MEVLERVVKATLNFNEGGKVVEVRVVDVVPIKEGTARLEGTKLFLPCSPVTFVLTGRQADTDAYSEVERWGAPCKAIVYRYGDGPGPQTPPKWSEVRQLGFTLQDKAWSAVRDFVLEHGPLGYVPPEGVSASVDGGWGWEPVGWITASLQALQRVTNLVQWAKEGRIPSLRGEFGEPRHWPISDGAPAIVIAEGDVPWRVSWDPWADVRKGVYRTPKTENELIRAAWETVLGWFDTWFREYGRIVPVLHPDKRRLELALGADTVIERAAAEFYLEQVVGVRTSCEECGNPVYPPRKRFCSEKCGSRSRKRHQRTGAPGTPQSLLARYLGRLQRRAYSKAKAAAIGKRLRQLCQRYVSAEEFQHEAERIIPRLERRMPGSKPRS